MKVVARRIRSSSIRTRRERLVGCIVQQSPGIIKLPYQGCTPFEFRERQVLMQPGTHI